MRNITSSKLLNSKQIDFFLQRIDPSYYQPETPLFYEGQIPQAAFILLGGEFSLKKNSKPVRSYEIGSLVGIKELIHFIPSKFRLTSSKRSKVIIISKSFLNEYLKDGVGVCHEILKEFIYPMFEVPKKVGA